MGRFLAGVASALLFVGAGLFFWQGENDIKAASLVESVVPPPPLIEAASKPKIYPDIPLPPAAPEQGKDEKRFSRYDQDRNGAVSQGEYLSSRRKAYERLDVNRDGKVSFAEYAVKSVQKFAKADSDRSGVLNHIELASTKAVRKIRPKPNCPKVLRPVPQPDTAADDDDSV